MKEKVDKGYSYFLLYNKKWLCYNFFIKRGVNMNQILYVEKNKKSGKLETKTVVKIFAIIILIFGIILAIFGGYKIYNSAIVEGKKEPIIEVSEIEGKLQIKVTHDKAIDKIIYTWNSEQENILQGKNRNEIIEQIEEPFGNNTLNIKVIDKNKKETTYQKEFYREEKDIIKPEIEFEIDGSKVKIVAKDETAISYIMYHWNNEEDTVVEVAEENGKRIEERISILKGENTLTIVAVDKEGNETKKEQIFKGAKKPNIQIEKQNDQVLITVTDEENIKKIDMNINGSSLSTDPENTDVPLNLKEAQFVQNLSPGNNTITVTAYNVSGLSEQVTQEITL